MSSPHRWTGITSFDMLLAYGGSKAVASYFISDGRHKRYVRLNFQCGINGKQCLYGKLFFTLNTKLPKTWIHLMFLAVQVLYNNGVSL